MKIKIFTLTHKKFDTPSDPMYQPLQVGHAVSNDLGYWCDDEGDNISEQNCYYSELTGFYWIWKNYHEDDFIGTCHYRRYLINQEEKVFTKEEYEKLLSEYDLITTLRVKLNNSYHVGFSANHNVKALDMTGEVIKEKYPEYYDNFCRLVNANETYFGNMIVTSHVLFDEYCEWLFSIFTEVQKRINLDTDEDDYHKRVFGFISEFLLLVWTTTKKLKVCECKVGMLGEKAETRELKERLATYFKERDVQGAKSLFLATLEKRPDVLMEASDVTGELKLSMQVIATVEQELKSAEEHIHIESSQKEMAGEYKQRIDSSFGNLLERNNDFQKLMQELTLLNSYVTKLFNRSERQAEIERLREIEISKEEAFVAIQILKVSQEEKDGLYLKILRELNIFR